MKRHRPLLLFVLIVLLLAGGCRLWLRAEQQQYTRNRQLINALIHDDAKRALALVNEGADPDTRQSPSPPPTFKRLLDHWLHHAPPSVNNTDTALILACGPRTEWRGKSNYYRYLVQEDVPLVEAMLTHGANVHAKGLRLLTALHTAASANRLRTVELLLQHGADVNAQDIAYRTPLMFAASNDTVNITHLLLAHSANVNTQDIIGRTPLYFAVRYNSTPAILPELLAHGADPDLRAHNGNRPLMVAQQNKRADLVRLLKRGAK